MGNGSASNHADSMLTADAMEAGGDVPFERMKVAQLKEELAVRGSTRTGLKMVLQRRLHAMRSCNPQLSIRRGRWRIS